MPGIIATILFYLFHPFYVSVTEINHNAQTKAVEVSVRIFFDDFEKALTEESGQKVNILKPANRRQTDALIAAYIKKHLKITADGKPLSFKYLGYEIEEDAAWCYLESPQVAHIGSLQIQNDILFAQYPEQTNMIHATVKGRRQSTKLDNPKSATVLTF